MSLKEGLTMDGPKKSFHLMGRQFRIGRIQLYYTGSFFASLTESVGDIWFSKPPAPTAEEAM